MLTKLSVGFKCHDPSLASSETMRVNVNDNENIIGTLVLPLWQDVNSLDDKACTGLHRALKSQIETVLADGDFKAKSGSLMSLR